MQTGRLISGNIIWRGLYLATILVINILLARYLGAAGSGWIFFTVNNLSFLILAGSLSLESGFTYFAASGQMPVKSLSGLAVTWSIIASILISLIYFMALPDTVPFIYSNTAAVCIILYVWGVLLTTYFSSFFYAGKQFTLPSLLPALVNLLLIILLILAAVYGGDKNDLTNAGPVLYFLSFMVQGAAIWIAWQARSKGEIILQIPARPQLEQLWKYSRMALLTNLVFFLVYRVDYWLVALYCKPDQLGNYIQVSKIGQVFLLLPGMLATVIFPVAAGETQNRVSLQLPVLSRLLFVLYIVCMLILVMVGGSLFPFMYGSGFNAMYPAFVWLAPGIIALSVQALLTAYYAGKNKLLVNLRGAVLALAIIIGGDLFIIPRYGINGAALVSSVGYLAYMIYMISRFRKDHPVSIAAFFIPQKNDLEILKDQFNNLKAAGTP